MTSDQEAEIVLNIKHLKEKQEEIDEMHKKYIKICNALYAGFNSTTFHQISSYIDNRLSDLREKLCRIRGE